MPESPALGINHDTPVLIFEIGTEEIPARFIPPSLVQLRERAERLFADYRLYYGAVKTYGTPRRLSLIVELDRTQMTAQREIWGPPAKVAFDDVSGAPTKAAEAFAQSHGIVTADIQVREKGKGSYVVAVINEASSPTAEVLPELLAKLVVSIQFAKTMRWGDGTLRFARPIHWIFALYDNQRVSFELEGLKSGASTRGHRFLSPASLEIKDGRSYVNLLRNNFVIVDPAERTKMIVEGSRRLAQSVGALLVRDDTLLEHVTNLVEYPLAVLASFSKEYLALPKELLITVMKDHQKYFALEDGRGSLSNQLVVVSNTRQENAETVRKGAEKVIRARFEDARFYFEEDLKVPIEVRQEKLKQVIFHEKLGTIHDKVRRISNLSRMLADSCAPAKRADAATAGLLCKNDLTSGVVFEFPELQGIMASYYVGAVGNYSSDVVQALREHYLPRFSGDQLPLGDCGALVSLADKLDNLAAFFALGLAPSGNEDPFALRRQAIGTILILLDRRYDLTLPQLIGEALTPFAPDDRQGAVSSLMRFFKQRSEQIFQTLGYSKDIIDAVSDLTAALPLHRLRDRMEALKNLKDAPGYEAFLMMIKRVNNIAPKDEAIVNANLFTQEEERLLYTMVEEAKKGLLLALSNHDPLEAIRQLTTLGDPVARFFDKVLIMDKDDTVKANRLGLIKSIQSLAARIADFSRLS